MGWATLSAAANRVAFDRLGSVSVTAGAASGRGFLAQNSELALGSEVVFIDYLLTVETTTFGGLTYGDAVTVDGGGSTTFFAKILSRYKRLDVPDEAWIREIPIGVGLVPKP